LNQFVSGVRQRGFGLLFFAIKAKSIAIEAMRAIIIAVYESAGALCAIFEFFPALIVPFLSCTGAMEPNEWKRLSLMLKKFYIFIKIDYRIVTG
jgi:hypothetical protein